jgi:hypothetical protein
MIEGGSAVSFIEDYLRVRTMSDHSSLVGDDPLASKAPLHLDIMHGPLRIAIAI